MGVTFSKVFWNDKTTTSSGVVDEITDCVSWTDRHAINVKSNTAEIVVKNIPSKYLIGGNVRFSVGGTSTTGAVDQTDDIEIYLGTAPVTQDNSDDLLCSMSITGIEERFDENQKSFRLSCADKTYLLLSHYVVGDYPQGGGSAPAYEIGQQMIRQWVNHTSSTADAIDVDTYVGTVQSDGSAMPDVKYSAVYKPIYECLSELSQQQYNGDIRPFIFWVDKQNKLHWIYPSQSGGIALNEVDDEIIQLKMEKNDANDINMIIYTAGKDKNGVNILDYEVSTESGSTLRMAYYDWSDITANMKLPANIGTQWGAWDNDTVRSQAKDTGKAVCGRIFAGKGLMWSGTITLKGTKKYVSGDMINLTSPTFGFANYKLRVMDITQSVSNSGWQTILDIAEDPKEIKVTGI
jgi:hypothetical protein